ncbi:MAG: ABC transporter substrate-binding protein [Eubacteriales bacterium]
MTRLILFLLTAVLLLPTDLSFAENVGTSITIGIQSTKTLTVRPFEPLERDMLSVYNAIYESLVTIDDDYLPQGCIAQSWEESNNGKYWTFRLRNDVRFSDGTPLTATDVVASANYILDRATDENVTDHGLL